MPRPDQAEAPVKCRVKPGLSPKVSALLALAWIPSCILLSQPADSDPQIAPPISDDRILGVIPNFQTVSNPHEEVLPLTVKQKFKLFAKETFDPFTPAAAAAGAAVSQTDNDDPKYGYGGRAYAQRFGAALADMTSQNFFQDAVLASLLHEDPRYFRNGPEYSFWHRVGHALSRVAVTRADSGKTTFNYAGILGMGMGIGLSNVYYPAASVNGTEVAKRIGTSLAASALYNLLPEFWPDLRQKISHHKADSGREIRTRRSEPNASDPD